MTGSWCFSQQALVFAFAPIFGRGMKLRHSKKLTVLVALVICASCTSAQKPSQEDLQTAEYLQRMGEILADYQEKVRALEAEVNKAAENFDLHEKKNPRAASLELADAMERLLEQTKPYISAIEHLTPPERLREHYAVNLECPRVQANSIEQMVRALRNTDKHSYAVAMEQYQKSIQDCPERIRATLQKAGFNSPEDIDKAINLKH